jgi:hypothetical protein
MSPMHGRKGGMDDREDLPLLSVLVPDILLATPSMHHSSFLVPYPPSSKSLEEISFNGGEL